LSSASEKASSGTKGQWGSGGYAGLFFVLLALLLEGAELFEGAGDVGHDAVLGGEQALEGGGGGFGVLAVDGAADGGGDDEAGGERGEFFVFTFVFFLVLGLRFGRGFIGVVLEELFVLGVEAGGLEGVDALVGGLDPLEFPGGGDDLVGEEKFEDVLGAQAGEQEVSEGVEAGLRFGGEDDVGAVQAVGGGVSGGAGFAVGRARACGFLGVLGVGGAFSVGT
jgi:hypothetical protein